MIGMMYLPGWSW